MPYVNVDAEVWIEPSDVIDDPDDEHLLDELKARGYNTDILSKIREPQKETYGTRDMSVNLDKLFELKRINSPAFDKAFSDYCWNNLGKVV